MNKARQQRSAVWVCLLIWLSGCAPAATPQAQLTGLPVQAGAGSGPFTRALGPRALTFPLDHGPHNDFQTEWWYYTGNLEDQNGARYGFQLTFFRRAIAANVDKAAQSSDWAFDQVYLAHLALTQIDAGMFSTQERLERGAAGLAGATGSPAYSVWLHDWKVEQSGTGRYQLQAATNDFSLRLELQEKKAVVLQGDRGYSRKGADPGNASIYYSLTRLDTSGTLTLNGKNVPVSGLSWMDHEFSTSALSKDQVGWDWFALQLDDGSEMMVYTLRDLNGKIDPYSRGIFVGTDGSTQSLGPADFEIQVEKTWKSPHSGTIYPAGWKVRVDNQDLSLQIEPAMADQELNVSFIYWEGAVNVSGTHAGRTVKGRGYTELTGYSRSMQGEF
jgi:predicted secreted hydrolase